MSDKIGRKKTLLILLVVAAVSIVGVSFEKAYLRLSTKIWPPDYILWVKFSFGDARSLIVNSPQTTHSELEPDEKKIADIPENLIRISAGLEDSADLIADLEQAFKKANT